MKVPSTGDSAKYIAKSKGVLREEESEESWRQTSGLTNRNLIRHYLTDKVAKQTEVRRLYGVRGVNEAGGWKEREWSYPRRSCSRAEEVNTEAGKSPEYPRIGASHCKKSDEGIVGGNPEGRNVRRDVVNERYPAYQRRQKLYT